MVRGVGASISHLQRLQGLPPPLGRIDQVEDGLARVQKENVLVVNLASSLQARAQLQVFFQHRERARAQLNPSILSGLGAITVHP